MRGRSASFDEARLASDTAKRLRPASDGERLRRQSATNSETWTRFKASSAGAFAKARERGSVLLFDEVDSLLVHRASARTSREAGQVNEMLTWLDHHPLPVIAATNHGHRLDPAALRRFVYKLDLKPLGCDRAVQAFHRFFGVAAPGALGELRGLTPGDFAVVVHQLRHGGRGDPATLVERLRTELGCRIDFLRPAGFAWTTEAAGGAHDLRRMSTPRTLADARIAATMW